MATANFSTCHAITVTWEGDWSDHPSDPGGATKYGITIGTLSKWRGKAVSKDAVRKLTRADAERIYRSWFWDKVKGDQLPVGVDLVTYDGAVNSGPSRSAKWTQGACGARLDGAIGPRTLDDLKVAVARLVVQGATDRRLRFL